jgi:hypothetical protein
MYNDYALSTLKEPHSPRNVSVPNAQLEQPVAERFAKRRLVVLARLELIETCHQKGVQEGRLLLNFLELLLNHSLAGAGLVQLNRELHVCISPRLFNSVQQYCCFVKIDSGEYFSKDSARVGPEGDRQTQ